MGTLRCDICDFDTSTFVRGWRAYIVDVQLVSIACPGCSELWGEDESPHETTEAA